MPMDRPLPVAGEAIRRVPPMPMASAPIVMIFA
jgi:hypothetical protein